MTRLHHGRGTTPWTAFLAATAASIRSPAVTHRPTVTLAGLLSSFSVKPLLFQMDKASAPQSSLYRPRVVRLPSGQWLWSPVGRIPPLHAVDGVAGLVADPPPA